MSRIAILSSNWLREDSYETHGEIRFEGLPRRFVQGDFPVLPALPRADDHLAIFPVEHHIGHAQIYTFRDAQARIEEQVQQASSRSASTMRGGISA